MPNRKLHPPNPHGSVLLDYRCLVIQDVVVNIQI